MLASAPARTGDTVIPQSVVFHLGGGSLPASNPKKTYLNFRNNLTMLYKNLPESELRHVMRVRCLLDYVAAFKSLILDLQYRRVQSRIAWQTSL